ncbi:MAG: PEP-CTERM sorting domain-containing protein [Phycisphaerae bacterium]
MLSSCGAIRSRMHVLVAAAAVAALPAFAAASVTTTGASFPTLPANPADNPSVVGTVDANSVGNGARGLASGRVDRQSFAVTAPITVGTVYFSASSLTSGQTVDVSILTTDDTLAKPLVDGIEVAFFSFVIPETASAHTNLQVDLDPLEQFTLPAPDTSTNPNAGYILKIQADAADTAIPMNLIHSNTGSDLYTYGRYRRDDGDQTSSRDFGFAMTAATTTPEPATLSLLTAAGATLLLRRRR